MKIIPSEFWDYAYNNFLDNANRGALAEFIVAKALGVTKSPYSSWESYDLESLDGVKVEVKASGYLQTWIQKRHSTPTFGIPKKRGWDAITSDFSKEIKRHADVYVFCLHHEKGLTKDMLGKEQLTIKADTNPLDTNNWTFWVVSTAVINEKLEEQKSVRISTIEDFLGIQSICFDGLKKAIESIK